MAFCSDKRYFEYQAMPKWTRKNCFNIIMPARFWFGQDSLQQQSLQGLTGIIRDQQLPLSDNLGYYFNISKSLLPKIKNLREFEDQEQTEVKIRFEEIMAMLLKQVFKNAQRTADIQFSSTVMTIPEQSMSILDRMRLVSILKLIGVKPHAFITETTAAAI